MLQVRLLLVLGNIICVSFKGHSLAIGVCCIYLPLFCSYLILFPLFSFPCLHMYLILSHFVSSLACHPSHHSSLPPLPIPFIIFPLHLHPTPSLTSSPIFLSPSLTHSCSNYFIATSLSVALYSLPQSKQIMTWLLMSPADHRPVVSCRSRALENRY